MATIEWPGAMAQKAVIAVADVQCCLSVRLASQCSIYNGTAKERKRAGNAARSIDIYQAVGVGVNRKEPPRRIDPRLNLVIVRYGEVQRRLRTRQIN